MEIGFSLSAIISKPETSTVMMLTDKELDLPALLHVQAMLAELSLAVDNRSNVAVARQCSQLLTLVQHVQTHVLQTRVVLSTNQSVE